MLKEIKYANGKKRDDDFEIVNIAIAMQNDGISIKIGAKKSTKDFFEHENKEEYFNEYLKEISQIVLKVADEINNKTKKFINDAFAKEFEEYLGEFDA